MFGSDIMPQQHQADDRPQALPLPQGALPKEIKRCRAEQQRRGADNDFVEINVGMIDYPAAEA